MKKIVKYLIVFLSLLIIVTPTYAKYTSNFYGLAWYSSFSGSKYIGELFVVEKEDLPEGTEQFDSKKLWGVTGNIASSNDRNDYRMGELTNVHYEALNNTNKPILIMFLLEYSAPNSNPSAAGGGGIIFKVSNTTNPKPADKDELFGKKVVGEIINEGNSFNDEVADVYFERDTSSVLFNASSIDYYKHTCVVDPRVTIGKEHGDAKFEKSIFSSSLKFTSENITITKEFIEDNFVLQPGEQGSFNIATEYQNILGGLGGIFVGDSSLNSCYVSVKLRAIPYEG